MPLLDNLIFTGYIHPILISFELEPTALTTAQGSQKEKSLTHLEFDIGLIRAFTVKFRFDRIEEHQGFNVLDQLCQDLESLQQVHIHPDFAMRTDWDYLSSKERTARFRRVVALLTLLQDRLTGGDLSLTFILHETDEFPWDPEMESGSDEEMEEDESLGIPSEDNEERATVTVPDREEEEEDTVGNS